MKCISRSNYVRIDNNTIRPIALRRLTRLRVQEKIVSNKLSTDVFQKQSIFQKLSKAEIKDFERQSNLLKNNNFKGLNITKGLSEQALIDLKNVLIYKEKRGMRLVTQDESKYFILLATSNKPAALTSTQAEYPAEMVKTFNSNGYDVLKESDFMGIINTFILNRSNVKKVIGKNLDFFQKRMKLDKEANIDEIYNILLSEKSPLKDQEKFSDIRGLILGYSRDNSLLFNLRNGLCKNEWTKSNLKDLFLSGWHPYREFDDKFKQHILKQIDKIKVEDLYEANPSGLSITQDKSYLPIYAFVAFVDEPMEFKRIANDIRMSITKLRQINKPN